MAKKPAHVHYIREWRQHRKISLRRLAARLEMEPGGDELVSYATLSRIENYKQPYSQPIINALADALDVEPWMLLKVNPKKDGQVIDMLFHLDAKKRDMALEYLKFLASQ